jgi:uncharacterized membrane protein
LGSAGGSNPEAALGDDGSGEVQPLKGRSEMGNKRSQLLRAGFATGAIIDVLAIWPMVIPTLGKLLWGIEDVSGSYRFAMGYGAALMLGWTGLLIWAYQRPVERRAIAPLTSLVICGFVATEIVSVLAGWMVLWRMIPTWILQGILITLFGMGYYYSDTSSAGMG